MLTAADLPTAWNGPERRFEPLASAEVVFVGQPVALVVGETEAAAADAAALVEIDLEPLEPVIDVIAASLPGAPMARVTPSIGDARAYEGNVFHRLRERRGNVAAAFGRCEAVVAGRFRAAWAYQAPIEPQVATAWLDADGTLAVMAAVQGTFFPPHELAGVRAPVVACPRLRVAHRGRIRRETGGRRAPRCGCGAPPSTTGQARPRAAR